MTLSEKESEPAAPAEKAANPIAYRLGGQPSRWAVTLFWSAVAATTLATALLVTTLLL
jgi:hypothetical protein